MTRSRPQASITMWRLGPRKCLLVVGDARRFHLQIVEGDAIVREEQMKSAEAAVETATLWRREELSAL